MAEDLIGQRALIRGSLYTWKDRLQKGQTFDSWDELKQFVIDHGVQTERIIRTYKKDPKRWLAICKMNFPDVADRNYCPVRIRAIEKKKSKIITIQICDLNHSCEASDHFTRRMHSNSDRLSKQIVDIVMRNRQTRACSLRDTVQALIHPDIAYHTAFMAKKRALERLDGREKDSFFLIPAHCLHILDRDPGATAKYSAPNDRFESLFVMPSTVKAAFKHCRPLVAFDGTHTRSAYPQILLIVTALDANNTVLMLAYYMVPIENPTEWNRFFRLIKDAIPDLSQPGMVFISDREKGLLDGVEDFFPMGFHAFCSWHLADNCRTKFNRKAQKAFEPLVYATTPEQYKRRLDRIRDHNKKWAEYIEKTANPKHYSRAFCPVRRWGHETSQQAESLNRALKPQRQEVALKQSNLLWDYEMAKFFEKEELAKSVTTPFPPNIMAIFKRIEEKAIQLIADASSDRECRITDHLGRQFLVEFSPEWKCTCGDFQDFLYPCVHAWRACTKLHKRHFNFVSPFYSIEKLKATYLVSVPAILHNDLVPNMHCGEPLQRRQRGRPSEKCQMRFSEEDPVRRTRKCTECKVVGHDRRTCPKLATVHAQMKGKGPTVESDGEREGEYYADDEEDSDGSVPSNAAAEESDSDKEPDEEFTVDAILSRKEHYCSDDEICPNGSSSGELSNGTESDDAGQSETDVNGQEVVDITVASQPFSQPSQCTANPETHMSFTDLLNTFLR